MHPLYETTTKRVIIGKWWLFCGDLAFNKALHILSQQSKTTCTDYVFPLLYLPPLAISEVVYYTTERRRNHHRDIVDHLWMLWDRHIIFMTNVTTTSTVTVERIRTRGTLPGYGEHSKVNKRPKTRCSTRWIIRRTFCC